MKVTTTPLRETPDVNLWSVAISVPAANMDEGRSSQSCVLFRISIGIDLSQTNSRTGLHRQSVQEVFQGLFSGHVSRMMRQGTRLPTT